MTAGLRVCLLTTFYPPANFGGDGIQVQRLARALAADGHAVTVVHAPEAYSALGGAPPGPPCGAQAADDGVRVVGLRAGAGALGPLAVHLSGRPGPYRRGLAAILAEGFDLLHFHNPSLLGGPGVLAMGQGLKLYTAHEHWLVCPTHVLWKDQREVCVAPSCLRCTLRYRRPPQLWRSSGLLRRSVAQLDALIVLSRTSERLHAPLASDVPLRRLDNFLPDPGPPVTGLGPPGESFLFVGRLESVKGVQVLVDAFRERPAHPLLIAGRGSLEADLRERAAASPNVQFLGWVQQDALDRLYREARAVIVPTLGHETFGLAAVEAFARGTPAIVHGFGALGDLLDDTGAGWAYRTPQELLAACDHAAADPAEARRRGARGRAAFQERWTPEAHLRGYYRLVAEVACRRGRHDIAGRLPVPDPRSAA